MRRSLVVAVLIVASLSVVGEPAVTAALDLPLPPDDSFPWITSPEDVRVSSMAATPDGEHLFATGRISYPDCEGVSPCFLEERICRATGCAVLFHSDDSGRSWERLPAEGLRQGTLLVAPGYPDDLDLYSLSGDLQRSGDGGTSFQTVPGTQVAGDMATMSPGFSDGDERILLPNEGIWQYDRGTGRTSPLLLVAPGVFRFADVAFDPGHASNDRIFATARMIHQDHEDYVSVVLECIGMECRVTEQMNSSDRLRLAVAPDLATSGAVVAWRGNRMWVSGDAGETFVEVDAPGWVLQLTFDAAGTAYASVLDVVVPDTSGGVARSTDGGLTWEMLGAGTVLERGVSAVSALPDGTLVAAPYGIRGVQCSADGGVTWAARCPS